MATLAGHFAVFNSWTEIDSSIEGHFMERLAPGAFKKTFREQLTRMRVLFQHGKDPQIGDKPLGPITELREDEFGAAYAVDLLDTGYVRELVPGLEAGLYGASFRFRAIKERYNPQPARAAHNPGGIPERVLTEVAVREFGPCVFAAYEGATAGLRTRSIDGGRLYPAGRLEDVDRTQAAFSGEPHMLRRLRLEAKTSKDAARILRAVERGEPVSIDWSTMTRSRSVAGPKSASYLLPRSRDAGRPRWKLSD